MRLGIVLVCLIFYLFGGCKQKEPIAYQEKAKNPAFLHQSVEALTETMVYDIFSPPVASRVYVYPSIAAYEVAINDDPSYRSLAGQLHGLSEVPKPVDGETYCFPLASCIAFQEVGKALIFSEKRFNKNKEAFMKSFEEIGVPEDVIKRSIDYGNIVAEHILDWASKDNYAQTRTYPKHDIREGKEEWQPTPPDYMDAIEPHWNKIRSFVIDSATQFIPTRPTAVDMDKGSLFHKEVMEVYNVGKDLTAEQKEIANFWDCNPYVSHHIGHVMFATKKITPGGHWMGIAKIAALGNEADFIRTSQTYALTGIALADAFISCWDEKFRSNLVRPETIINEHIDEEWEPLLQTPPFPEYTSGHSVISRSAARALTSIYGETFQYIDSTEMDYGLPMRKFNSFLEASEEAAVSRLYGGIHYRPAIENGIKQGDKVGKFVVSHLKWKK